MYYARYRSSTAGTTGCVKEFLTKPQEHANFPPQVTYECDLCPEGSHGFRLTGSTIVSTPRQDKALREYCLKSGIEQDVELT